MFAKLDFSCLSMHLTPKVLLSPVGTIWTLGRLVQFQFMLRFFEIFMEDVVFYKLCMHIILAKLDTLTKSYDHFLISVREKGNLFSLTS